MNPKINRISTLLLNIGTLLGFFLAIAGLVAVWAYRGRVQTGLQSGLDLAARSVDATSDMLIVVGSSLEQAKEGLGTVESTARDLGGTLDATSGITETIGVMMGEEFVTILGDARTALASMQTSSRLIDDTLKVISSIPIIGKRYQPEVTLHESIGDLSESLDPIPLSLIEIQTEMEKASSNLDQMQTNLDELADSLSGIESDLADASAIVIEYQDILADIGDRIDGAASSVSVVVNGIAVLLSLIFIWMLLIQGSIYIQARQLATMETPETTKGEQ